MLTGAKSGSKSLASDVATKVGHSSRLRRVSEVADRRFVDVYTDKEVAAAVSTCQLGPDEFCSVRLMSSLMSPRHDCDNCSKASDESLQAQS